MLHIRRGEGLDSLSDRAMFPTPIVTRDEGKVFRLCASASGRVLAVAMDTIDGEVRTYDALSLKPRGRLLLGAMRTVRACALGPEGAQLAVATHEELCLFDLQKQALEWRFPLAGDHSALAFSPDGTRVAVGRAPESLVLLDARNGESIAECSLSGEPQAVAWDAQGIFSADGAELWLFEGALQRPVRAALPPGTEDLELCAMSAKHCALSGTTEAGPWVELVQRSSGKVLFHHTVDGDRRSQGLAFAGGTLFVATDGGTYRLDPPFDQLIRWLPPMGGVRDPTRLAAVVDSHIAVAARDVRVFRTRS